MECMLDDEGKLMFKLSEPVTVMYKSNNMRIIVEEILGHIVCLLGEAQKLMESGEQSRVVKSIGHQVISQKNRISSCINIVDCWTL